MVGDAVEYGGGDEVVGVLVAGDFFLLESGGLGIVEEVVEVGIGGDGVGVEDGEGGRGRDRW